MLVLQLLAAFLLFLSIALFFGPQFIAYGPRALPQMFKQKQVRFVSGFLVTSAVFVVVAPHFGSALLTGGEHVSLVAVEIATMTFGL